MNGNGQALIDKLTEEAKEPGIVAAKRERLEEVQTLKTALESERSLLNEKIKNTDYSETDTRDRDIEELQRLGAVINLNDDQLVAYDKEITRIEDEIKIIQASLFNVERDSRETRRSSNVLNNETKQYADEAESFTTSEALSLLKQAHIDLTEDLNEFSLKKSDLLKRLCELVKARAVILAKRAALEGKVQGLTVESENLNHKIETSPYNDEILEAIDDAKFSYLEKTIEECERSIARLSTSPDRLRKKALEAYRKGETERYEDLVEKLKVLSEIEETPQYPEEIGTYFVAEAAKPSENRLRRMIYANKDALPSIKIKTNLKLNKNVDMIIEIVELLYLQIRYQVAIAEAEKLPESAREKSEMIQKGQFAVSNIEAIIAEKQEALVDSEKIILDNMAKQRLYELAISRAETDRFLLAGGEDLELENYGMQNDMILAKHSTRPKKEPRVSKENNEIKTDIPSYEELSAESYELPTAGISLLEDNPKKEVDEVPTLESIAEKEEEPNHLVLEEIELPTLDEQEEELPKEEEIVMEEPEPQNDFIPENIPVIDDLEFVNSEEVTKTEDAEETLSEHEGAVLVDVFDKLPKKDLVEALPMEIMNSGRRVNTIKKVHLPDKKMFKKMIIEGLSPQEEMLLIA